MGSLWLKLVSFATKIITAYLIFGGIVYIGLHKFVKALFSFLNWLIASPYRFLEVSLDLLYFLDLRLAESLVKFVGFITPRSEFFTIFLYLILSVPLLMLKILFYSIFFLLKVPSFFFWFLKIVCFAILVPPLVYAYDLVSLILYYAKFLYYTILSLCYKIAKLFIRGYLLFLELRLFRQHVREKGRKLNVREMRLVFGNINKRFRFEQFGNVSSSKISNYYDNSGTFDLDQYFLGPIPFSVYVAGRHAHEHNRFSSAHELIHEAKFFYQPLKKRKLLRFSYPRKIIKSSIGEDPIYNTVRVFEYHGYVSMGLVQNFNFSSFPEYYRSKLFSRLLRFNLVPAINFYYNIFNSTLRNKSKNPDFWTHYRRVVTNPTRGLTWFEYSRNLILKDPIFSYNNYDYVSPSFGRKLTNRRVARKRFRELSISEGSRTLSDDYRSSTDSGGKAFTGSHFTQFVDDYDHYLKTKIRYKSRMERFWFKRVLFPDSGLASDGQLGLPALFPGERVSVTYKQQFGSFFGIVLAGLLGGVAQLYNLLATMLLTCYQFFIFFLAQLRQSVLDFLFKFYLFFVLFILRLPALFVRSKRRFAPVYEFFTYPIKMTPLSILWTLVVLLTSLFRTVMSISKQFYVFICVIILGTFNFIIAPLDFIRFIFICIKEGNLESLVYYELEASFKEMDDFIEWLLNGPDK